MRQGITVAGPRTSILNIRVTEEERAELKRRAAGLGITVSRYIRHMIGQSLAPAAGPATVTVTTSSGLRLVMLADGSFTAEGILWDNGTTDPTLTIGET